MNTKKISGIFTVALATILLSSVAYAAKKKIQTKFSPKPSDVSETDLAAELTRTKDVPKQKTPAVTATKSENDEKFKEVMDKIASR